MITFTFCSFKGGTAKTTTAIHIGACLSKFHRKKILLIDLDSQANLSIGLGIGPDNLETMVPVLKDEKNIKEVIQATSLQGLYLIPANAYLDGIEKNPQLGNDPYAHERLRRSLEDINRAVGLGYWPDVRIVQYDSEHIRSKISIDQHQASGLISASEDYRSEIGGFDAFSSDRIGSTLNWAAAIPFTNFYQYYQESPIAAYLIPKNLPDGTSVLVVDPIEDIVGSTWNQGDSYRATNVPGYILNHRVILDRDKVKVIEFVG